MFTVLNVISYKVLISEKLFRITEIFTTKILVNVGLTLLPLHQRKIQGAPVAFRTLGFSYLIIHESNSKNLQKTRLNFVNFLLFYSQLSKDFN